RGVLHDLFAGDLPGLLNDPRERTVLTSRLILDLLQHLFGKVQALFALVGTAHWMTKPPVVVVEVGQCKISHGPVSRNASMNAAPTRAFVDGNGRGDPRRRGDSDDDIEWNAAKNLQSLTGGFAATILAGYFTHR